MLVTPSDAIHRLNRGEVVAIPTDTVYGLAAPIHNLQAVEHLYALKGRPRANPMLTLVPTIANIEPLLLSEPPFFYELADAFWPGPLTLVLPVDTSRLSGTIRAGLPTAGFRIPGHPITLEILAATGPLVCPSANLSGKPSSTTAAHVAADFDSQLPIVDAGAAPLGLESTILIFENHQWHVTREGTLPLAQIAQVLGYIPTPASRDPARTFAHYQPQTKLLLGPYPGTPTVLGFANRTYPGCTRLIPVPNDPDAACHELYSLLRDLDTKKIEEVWVDTDLPDSWALYLSRIRAAAGA